MRIGLGVPPLEIGDLSGANEVDFGAEWTVEAMLPTRQRAQDRQVARREFVAARLEDVRELAAADEDCDLARTHDESCSLLDFVLVARKAPHQCVLGIIDPFDDVYEFGAQFVEESHLEILSAATRTAAGPKM